MIVDTCAKNGDIGSELGAVELTLALYSVFYPAKDKIVWDVYAHKILTGRKDRFHTLRKYGGLRSFIIDRSLAVMPSG